MKNSLNDFVNLYNKNVYIYIDVLVNIIEKYDLVENEYIVDVNMLFWNFGDDIGNYLFFNNIIIEILDFYIMNLIFLYEEYVRVGGYENWCYENY